MPPSQPWRDIPSAAAVQQELSRLNIEDNLQRLGVLDGGKAAKQRTSLKTRLYADVAHYHRVPKDRLSTLMPREAMLRGIAASASALWANAGGRATQMGPTIASLADRAIQKANYLRKLYDFYKGEGAGVFRGQDLLNFLKSPPHASGGHLANLQRGCRLERIDPAHRSSEVHLDPSTPFNLDSLNCGMNWAFAEWCGALMQAPGGDANDIIVRKNFTVNDIDAASLPPFFLWLEKHRICVGSDTDAFGTFNFSPAEVTGVLFSPYGQASRAGGGAIKAVQGIHWLVPSSDGVLVEMPLDDPKSGMRLFDTMHLSGKKGAEEEKQSAAYAWTQCGTLLVGEHASGEFHHSSFVAGDAVRCAGMIRVAGGKVDMISSNSGHYRPSEANLRQFASWLNDRQVFTPSAFARFFRGNALVNEEIGVFLGLRATTGRFGRANQVTPALDQLGQLVATAVTRYNASGTRVKAFSFMRGLTKSTESKEAVAYLQGDFPRDLEVAKLNTSEEKWWNVPVNVIQSLLGEPGSVSFAKIQGDAQKLSPVIGRSNPRFSAGIGRLVPLKNPSTLHSILAEEWAKWRRPKPVG
jgi:hypothetical protein